MDPSIFAQFGIVGLVLYWFMVRNDKKISELSETNKNIAKAINNQTIIMISLMDVISSCPNNDVSKKGKKLKEEEIGRIKEDLLKQTT